jgi:P-type Ca2+ transporter type 2C
MSSKPVHALRKGEVFEVLETSPEGLSAPEAKRRLTFYGPNLLSRPKAAADWRKWARMVAHPMALLLWLAGAAALVGGRGELGVIIWVVVVVNAGFSFWREYRAGQAVNALETLLPTYALLIRAGQEVKVPAAEVVPGDILYLAEGDNIPADARVIEEFGLRTNNSTLTGESMPVRRSADASLVETLTEVERPNLVFAGASVVSGTGKAVVYATGMLTQFGRISNLTQAVKEEPSLVQKELGRVARYLSLAGLGLGLIVLAVGTLQEGMNFTEAFILAIGILVAAVPEGLTPTITLTLAMAVQRLAQQGVLVKKLSIAETLGTTSVICTDKSGTLTQNQMTVRKVWLAGVKMNVSGSGYNPFGEFSPAPARLGKDAHKASLEDLQALLAACLLCNNARLNPPAAGSPRWTCLGDQTEAALLTLALKGGLQEQALREAYPRVHELPFDARRKRMSTIHRQGGKEIAFVKGSPKEVLQLCTQIEVHGQNLPLDRTTRAEILAANDDYAQSALRVMGLAKRELPPRTGEYSPESVECELTFLGLVAMMDPPRPEVAQAMQVFHSAGIRMVMITGDYGLTAESLARRVGMLTVSSPRILTGSELDTLSDRELQDLLAEETIFARMAPEHKVRLVSAFQARGEVVAVIGDGVNDAPCLRKADIGIAMGISGTDVAREAADVVLVNDDFAAVVKAIEEGRAVFDNLRKFITYIFASNIPEIMPFILSALFNLPLALRVTQILAIDLGTDLLPALALGIEKPEPGVMERPPRSRTQPLVDKSLLLRAFVWLGGMETVLCYAGFFWVYQQAGISPGALSGLGAEAFRPVYLAAITVFHVGVVTSQVGNLFACRSETRKAGHVGWKSSPFLLVSVGIEIIVILLMVYLPPLAKLFEHVSIPPIYWAGLFLYAPLLYSLDVGRKILTGRKSAWITKEVAYEDHHHGMRPGR